MIFDYYRLNEFARTCRYQDQWPFPHAVIDEAANNYWLMEAMRMFPEASDVGVEWYRYDNPLEKKMAFPHIDRLQFPLRDVFYEMNSGRFMNFLEDLTGIAGLIPDPHFNGGGCHMHLRGGKLDLHCDYNYHPRTNLDRRLNVLLYINPIWEESWGGSLELRTKDLREYTTISPKFNRMVVFSTTEHSYHGHPRPISCPEGVSRRSLAAYYYSNGRPDHEKAPKHSTVFVEDPMSPSPELNELRLARSRGRIPSSEVQDTKPKNGA